MPHLEAPAPQRREHRTGPFGTPDASRADLHELLGGGFVEFEGAEGVATHASDRHVRAIIGAKGAGKTAYVRRLHADANDDDSVATAPPVLRAEEAPSTESVFAISERCDKETLTETWTTLWRCAVIAATAGHLATRLRSHLTDEQIEELENEYQDLLKLPRRPRTVYGELTRLTEHVSTSNALHRAIRRSGWIELAQAVTEMLRRCPPLFLYLDGIDDSFERAPNHWLRCQKGLFYAVMQPLRGEGDEGGRLHVVATFRDLVMSSVMRSEHGGRYRHDPHIQLLEWDSSSIRTLLRTKAAQLPRPLILGGTSSRNPVAKWLGRSHIRNIALGIEEPIEKYLLRHTTGTPRDAVAVGNALCSEMERLRRAGLPLTDDEIRRVVSAEAEAIGKNLLRLCTNQIAADQAPRGAAAARFVENYTGPTEYARNDRFDQLRSIVSRLRVDRFTEADLARAEVEAREAFGVEISLRTILWQHGLLGYVTEGERGPRAVFYSLRRAGEFSPDADAKEFLLHPCMIDAVEGLRSKGPEPIQPFTDWSEDERWEL